MKVKITTDLVKLQNEGLEIFEVTPDLTLLLILLNETRLEIYVVDRQELDKIYQELKNGK